MFTHAIRPPDCQVGKGEKEGEEDSFFAWAISERGIYDNAGVTLDPEDPPGVRA